MINEFKNFIDNPHEFGKYLGYTDLVSLHSDWIKWAWLDKSCHAIQAHRNSFKTTSIIIVGTIWYLLFVNENSTNLIIRKADSDAQKVVRAIRQHFESRKIIEIANYLYGVKTLETENWSNSSITLSIKKTKTPEGSVDCKSVQGSVTGSHYDNIIPDDIITLKDRVSRAEREATKDFIRELRNIIKDGGKLFFSGTPWHNNDGWTIIPEPIKYPIGTVPIKGFTADILDQKIKELKSGTTISLYASNYELMHIADEESIFPEPIYGNWPDELETIAHLDAAYSGTHTTALSVGGEYEGKYYARGYVWRENIVNLYDEIIQILKHDRVGSLVMETNADKGLSLKEFERRWPACRGYSEWQNKHIKIMSYGARYFDRFIWHHDTDIEYMAQMIDYREKQEPNDAPDSFSCLVREMGFSGADEVYIGIA